MKIDKILRDLLESRSPTGCEFEAIDLISKFTKSFGIECKKDVMGNRIATIGGGSDSLMLAAHIDEIGLIITYIDSDGFLSFDQLGGHDNIMLSGRRVSIITKRGIVNGVTGKRAIHLMDAKERKEVPETHSIWIDIGVKSKEEAEKLVSIGDSAVFMYGVEELAGGNYVSRAFDDKAGCYCIFKALKNLNESKKKLEYKVVSVATVQEEIGTRGAIPAGFSVDPKVALVVDVEHATDFPSCDKRKYGEIKLGRGVVISRGPNISPIVFEKLVRCAEKNKISYQVNAEPRPTGTDARVLQMTRSGVATGLLGIPLRYMHTPSEMANLDDIESCVNLIEAFALSLKKGDEFRF